MLARDRVTPLAASATMLVCAPLVSIVASTSVVRVPTTQAHGMRVLEWEATVNRRVLPVRATVAVQERHETFTRADLAVLDAVDQARAEDDALDYTGLFDYDD